MSRPTSRAARSCARGSAHGPAAGPGREHPHSVGAYVDFLAHEGLFAPGCSPSAVRRACADLQPRFLRKMTDPANFGMAKSLFGGLGHQDVAEQLARLTGMPVEQLLDDAEPCVVGPVRAPTDAEVAAAIVQARMFTHVRGLAARCGAPGLALTAKGNLRRADARRLTEQLGTGEHVDIPGRTLGSATDLPYLTWLVDTAIAAGAVRRLRGRLVATARFADRSDRDAYERTVRGALEAGLGSPMSWAWRAVPRHDDGLAIALLTELLDAGDAGAAVEDVAAHVAPLLGPFGGLFGGNEVEHQLARLADLGLVNPGADGPVTLTAAGRAVGATLVAEAGVEVVLRADPAALGHHHPDRRIAKAARRSLMKARNR